MLDITTFEQIISSFNALKARISELEAANKSAVLVLGLTGVGKSTLINYLQGRAIIQQRGPVNGLIADEKSLDKKSPVIGESAINSQTKMPDLYDCGKDYWLCDTQGLLDSDGEEGDIISRLSLNLLLQSSMNIKGLVIVIDTLNLVDSNAREGLNLTFNALGQYFKTTESIKNSTTFVFTKQGNTSKDEVYETINSILAEENLSETLQDWYQLILDNIQNTFKVKFIESNDKEPILINLDSLTPVNKTNIKKFIVSDKFPELTASVKVFFGHYIALLNQLKSTKEKINVDIQELAKKQALLQLKEVECNNQEKELNQLNDELNMIEDDYKKSFENINRLNIAVQNSEETLRAKQSAQISAQNKLNSCKPIPRSKRYWHFGWHTDHWNDEHPEYGASLARCYAANVELNNARESNEKAKNAYLSYEKEFDAKKTLFDSKKQACDIKKIAVEEFLKNQNKLNVVVEQEIDEIKGPLSRQIIDLYDNHQELKNRENDKKTILDILNVTQYADEEIEAFKVKINEIDLNIDFLQYQDYLPPEIFAGMSRFTGSTYTPGFFGNASRASEVQNNQEQQNSPNYG